MTSSALEPDDLNDRPLRDRAAAAARGDAPFDLLIVNGDMLDSVTGEIRKADIGTTGPMIASVHAPGSRTDAEETIDAAGKLLTAGLIDAHMHVESSMVTPATYAETILPRGVTTVVWDPHEFGNVHGLAGVDWAVEATSGLPMRFIVLAPSCVPSAPGFECAGAAFGGTEMEAMLANPGIGGVAEVMNMAGVVSRDALMTDIVQAGLASGKPVFGHARGLSGPDLNAFMAAGVTSDHELTSADDFLEKLRAGLTIEIRGSHDHLLPEIVEALNGIGHLPPTVTLCTDDVFPDDLDRNGGLDDVIRRLVRYGMPPVWAIRAATLNAATRLGRNDLGLIAAGRRADLVAFNDLQSLKADFVIGNGAIVARKNRMSSPPHRIKTDLLEQSVRCPQFTPEDLIIKANGNRVRVATIDRPRFTRWREMETEVKDGHVVPPEGATLIGVCHRHGRLPAEMKVGYLTEWGAWNGAVCTTVSHDSHNLTVFGGNEADMALAANTVCAMDGGLAVVSGGVVLASLPLPLSGLVSEAPMADVSTGFTAIKQAMDKVVAWQPPYLVFKACFGATLACNAGPHQTDLGLSDLTLDGPLESPVLEVID
ncbi:MAG: adenine deaminase 2 [Rhizobiaceae bacterium MnEN-MB40S]|nr:MAG: adenine deaminase 2 [Rhizobiaceae bacterium MnEN-MB40S]